MSKFKSNFAPTIDAMLEYRVALGLSASTLANPLGHFDRYCAEHYPDSTALTKEMIFDWLTTRAENSNVSSDASAVRKLGEYLNAVGQIAYILPQGFYPVKSNFTAYNFTDAELSALFRAVDALPRKRKL